MYTDRFEHVSTDGTVTTKEIDGDDGKQWSCHIRLLDKRRKLVISFPFDNRSWDYRWDLKRLTRTGIEKSL